MACMGHAHCVIGSHDANHETALHYESFDADERGSVGTISRANAAILPDDFRLAETYICTCKDVNWAQKRFLDGQPSTLLSC